MGKELSSRPWQPIPWLKIVDIHFCFPPVTLHFWHMRRAWPLHTSYLVAMGKLRWPRMSLGGSAWILGPQCSQLQRAFCALGCKKSWATPKTRAQSCVLDPRCSQWTGWVQAARGCGRLLKPVLESFAFSVGLIEVKGDAGMGLESVSSCRLSGVGMLGDLRNKEFPEFTRALHIFKLLCQSNDTVA